MKTVAEVEKFITDLLYTPHAKGKATVEIYPTNLIELGNLAKIGAAMLQIVDEENPHGVKWP